jgi:hypothetical protein
LPARSPGPPRHNYGSPNLSTAHSWHRGVARRAQVDASPVSSC